MYLFVYKTVHKNGKYYIGRHQTNDLDDGYLGSGKWVKSIKDTSELSREVITEANSTEELYQLEEYYINLHWEDPLCMNYVKGSRGWTSEDAKKLAEKNIKNGTHHFLTREDGTNFAADKVKNGTHNFQKRLDGTSLQTDRVGAGTHHLLKRPDGTSLAQDRVKNGTHHLLKRPDGTSLAQDKVKGGSHHFLTRPDGSNINTDRVKEGTHHLLQNKGFVACYNKQGEYKRIPKEEFYSQSGPKKDWEWVGIKSNEGKDRKKNQT